MIDNGGQLTIGNDKQIGKERKWGMIIDYDKQ